MEVKEESFTTTEALALVTLRKPFLPATAIVTSRLSRVIPAFAPKVILLDAFRVIPSATPLMVSRESVPQWYAQTYSMVTFVEEGHGGTVNASANYYVDMGGAHPNQWSRWINYDFNTGKQLTKEDVFRNDALEDVERILFSKLLADRAELHSDAQVKTLEDLQALGYLQMTSIYIPDNFLLSKNAVMFLFNRYDIAPYSAGEIVLEVPYEEIGHCLNNK